MSPSLTPALSAAALLCLAPFSMANERHFAFTYEAATAPKGSFEYEQQVFWERGSGFDTFQFRQELEYGVTDRLQIALYFFDFEHAREDGSRSTKWAGSGLEAIYQMTDPNKSAIGSALYGEVLMNGDELELETKLILQKNLGPFIIAWNGILEAKWEDGYRQDVGVLEQTLGVSYQVRPSFSVGFEAKQEVAFENWRESGGNAVFVGPNIALRKNRFFATATCLFRVTDVPGEPHLELGTVIGFHF
jgi:hypothetical protein